MGIPAILAGILTQLALYSINLKIMGKANQSINVDKYGLLISLRWVKEFALHNPIIMVILVTAVVIGVLYWFFGTELGCAIRATGSNPAMSRAQGINTNFNIVLGLAVSNASGGPVRRSAEPVSGLCRCRHGPRRHRHRSGRRHHRRGGVRPHLPQLRPQDDVRRRWAPSSTTSSSSWC